jgi:predicted nucleic acid-binding protein
MIVADTNLVAQLILSLDLTADAQEVYRRDPDWRLPELWRHEFLNVLASYLRFDKVPAARLLLAWQRAAELFGGAVCEVDMPLALEVAGERDISAYDAQYVALARALSVPLVTEDRKLRRAAPREAISMKQFLVSTIKDIGC